MQSTTAFRSLLLTLAALSFAACGSDSTDPAGGGGGGGGGEVPEFPEIPPAAQIFTDDIDSENGGIGEANYEGWANWTVTEGCVDLHGPQSTDPLAALGIGVYMDLDGSCLEAGTMETKTTFDFEVGDYTLEFLIAGNSQLGPQLDTLDVAVGGALSERIVLDWQDPLALMSFDFTVGAATSGKIRLEHHGGDEQGILIDAIRLRRN
ncbi:MAG TPA: hypothetical protein ENO23_07910 [Alphaproteobacteria bacterium]|nr:hypothetical protein [Alphaproteobacteria bacterium]